MTGNLNSETICDMMENLLTGVAFIGMQEDKLEFLYMNNGAFRMLGYSPEFGNKYANNLLSVILEEDKPKFWQALEDVLKDNGAVDLEIRTVTASGSLRWLQVRGNLYEKTNDRAVILCIFMDATDRKFVEDELRIQSEWYQMLLETEGETLFDYNTTTDVLSLKTANEYGLESSSLIDRFSDRLGERAKDSAPEKTLSEIMAESLKIPRTDTVELELSLPKMGEHGGEKRWYRIHTSSIAGVDGYVTHIVGKITDIHETRLLLEEMREKEKLDELTGWYNIEGTKDQIMRVLLNSRETDIHAFMLVNMNEFRLIKESLGEDTGNRIIQEVTKRIGRGFKRSDILGRISGEEFVIFVQNIGSILNLDTVASRVSHITEVKLGAGEDGIILSATVGVSVYPYQGESWDELFLRAEKAVNTLKMNGKSGYHIYDLSGLYKKEFAENERASELSESADGTDDIESLLKRILGENRQNEGMMRTMLKLVLRHYGFHKAFLSIAAVNRSPSIEYSFCEPGYEPKAESDTNEPEKNTWFRFLKELELLDEGMQILHNYDPIPQELASYMLTNKIHTILIQPMMMRGKVSGVFVMGECTGREWRLKRREEDELRRIMQLMQMYVLRYERQQNGQPPLIEVGMLDDFDNCVMAVDGDTYELVFANRRLLEKLPDLQIGDCCYRTYAHQDRPCEMCVMKNLDRNDPRARWSEERFSNSMRSWLKLHASWMQNEPGNAVCVINGMDISEYFMGGGLSFTP